MSAITSQDRFAAGCRSSSFSDYSDSDYSASTAPTDTSARPPVQHYKPSGNPYENRSWDIPQYSSRDYVEPKVSAYTVASSVSSEDPIQDLPSYHAPDDHCNDAVAAKPLASTPQEFAQYFPSTQRLCIRHDDSTLDGNMNLRLYTRARTCDGNEVDLGLFHLRMHDLKHREFSLRRYCRDSGREICHSSRKSSKPFLKRPSLQRSMSSALHSFRSKPDTKAPTSLKRQDSGYDSLHEDDDRDDVETSSPKTSSHLQMSANTTVLEFSNYAHLEIKHRGSRASEKYEFEYWGTKYAWKRIAVGSGKLKEISYHLYDTKSAASLAHIVPIQHTSSELEEESARGGWVPPSAMRLEEVVVGGSTDLAE